MGKSPATPAGSPDAMATADLTQVALSDLISLKGHDIRVLGVAPTFCETEGNTAALGQLPDRVRQEIAATLTSHLGRVGVPDDIVRVVLFAASGMALFMTGSTLLADAGEVA